MQPDKKFFLWCKFLVQTASKSKCNQHKNPPNWNQEIERLISLQVLLIKSVNAFLHKITDPLELSYLTDKGSAICIQHVVFSNLLDCLINTRL